ncbi:hypothetical protein JCM3774_001353 [Rhodotorula dairenensis]
MNAHHRKASYRPQPPAQPRQRYAAGAAAPLPLPPNLADAVRRIPCAWQLDAVVPHAEARDTDLVQRVADLATSCGTADLATSVNLARLLDVEFLQAYVRQGHLVALSLEDGQDADIVCLDGRGRLVLSVTKDSYESLGLPGRASAFGSHRQRYITEIDLRAASFRAGKPGFEKVKHALANWPARADLLDELGGQPARRPPKRFDLILSYTDSQGEPRPVRFTDPEIACSTIPPTMTIQSLTDIAVPLASALPRPPQSQQKKKRRISSGSFRLLGRDRGLSPLEEEASSGGGDPASFWEQYREWAGLCSLVVGEAAVRDNKLRWHGQRPGKGEGEDAAEDTWGLPRESCRPGNVSVISATGMFHPLRLADQIGHVAASEHLVAVPFLSLSLQPFSHSPLSHTSAAANPPVVGTAKKPNGKKRKRGRGRGEEEEADPAHLAEHGGWDLVMLRRGAVAGEEETVAPLEWHMWEMP